MELPLFHPECHLSIFFVHTHLQFAFLKINMHEGIYENWV